MENCLCVCVVCGGGGGVGGVRYTKGELTSLFLLVWSGGLPGEILNLGGL